MAKPKPLLFLTGFLGAGKTTLLRALLEELKHLGLTADVILNDYENAEIDAATLPEYTASIFPIAASCACCDSLEELVGLCSAAQKSKGDVLLIELNGTADPLPILESFTVLEDRLRFHPRWQAGVVDSRNWGKRAEFSSLEQRQLETATHWMPSHTTQLSESEIQRVVEKVERTNSYAQMLTAASLASKLASVIVGSESNGAVKIGKSFRGGGFLHDPEHELSHQFTGCQIPMPGRYRREQIERFMEALPVEVIRAKALVKLKETPGSRWLFERSGYHSIEKPQQVFRITRAPASLICIGPQLNPQKLRDLVNQQFGI